MRYIIITTINKKTEAIEKFDEICSENNWRLVIVGDRKTPAYKNTSTIKYLSIEEQFDLYGTLASLIPENHYCRKNLGYIYAIGAGATEIYDTDDDNIPYKNFYAETSNPTASKVTIKSGWNNIYSYFSSEKNLWPRGLPLDQITAEVEYKSQNNINLDIFQGLADLDPDVDAIYRLLNKREVKFNQKPNILLGNKAYCPFNSQNTLFNKKAFPLLYLPCHVSFRMTDIWRSFVAQCARQSFDLNIGFGKATVYQHRNTHDLMKDFQDEVVGYLKNNDIMNILCKLPRSHSMESYLYQSASALANANVYEERELKIIEEWNNLLCN